MKVIHLVLGKANPERMNGVSKVVHHLADHQHRRGMSVEVWGLTPDPQASTPPRSYPLRLFRRGRSRFMVSAQLVREFRGLSSDAIVHFHGSLLPEWMAVSRTLSDASIPWVITPHGAFNAVAMSTNRLVKGVFANLFERRLVGRAHALHICSEGELDGFPFAKRHPRVVPVPNGQALEEPRDLSTLGTGRRRFVFCGRMATYEKGLDLLVDGFAAYQQAGGSGALTLIGDGPDRGAIEARVRAQSIKDIEFVGARFGEDKLNILRAGDVFVHTSRREGMPTAVLEAASVCLPLMLTQATNLVGQMVRWDAGLAITESTVRGVAAAMHAIDAAPAEVLRGWGRNAREMIAREFSWSRTVDELDRCVYAGARG